MSLKDKTIVVTGGSRGLGLDGSPMSGGYAGAKRSTLVHGQLRQ